MGIINRNILCSEPGQELCLECGAICFKTAPTGLCPECEQKRIAEDSRVYEIIMGDKHQEGDSEPTEQAKIFGGIIGVAIEEGLVDTLCKIIRELEQLDIQAREEALMSFRKVFNSLSVDYNEDYRMLLEMGVLGGSNVPYNEYLKKGYFVVV
jgi:hypothetical protein